MKNHTLFALLMLMIFSCSKENNEAPNAENIIRTSGLNFVPSTLNCNIGDTVFF